MNNFISSLKNIPCKRIPLVIQHVSNFMSQRKAARVGFRDLQWWGCRLQPTENMMVR